MKRILLIATGGTIASENHGEGLFPVLDPAELLRAVPGISAIAKIGAIRLYSLDSSNLRAVHWVGIGKAILAHWEEYDGFVITHGTDTMAYTAAALSYMIEGSPKPIVLTGAQKSVAVSDGDARRNLTDAFLYAVDDSAAGVHIVFDGRAITGTRARKTRTKSFNAFSSVDYPDCAVIRDGRVIPFLREPIRSPVFRLSMKESVLVLKLVPGMRVDLFYSLLPEYDALILESFGVGGIPYYESEDFTDAVAAWVEAGKTVVITTQVEHEGSDMATYRVGFTVKEKYELLEAYNMTLEAVYTKLMWILSQTSDRAEIRRLFELPIAHDRL